MHVLVFPSWYPVHADAINGIFFRDHALALADAGHQVGVIAPGLRSLRKFGRNSCPEPAREYELDNGVATYRSRVWAALPRVPYGNYWLWKQAAERLLKRYISEQGKPHVIHAHAAVYAGAVAAEWGKRLGVPVVLTEHSSGFAQGSYRPWQIRLVRKAVERASARIAVSPELGRLLEKKLGPQSTTWEWVPNVVGGRFATACVETAEPDRGRPARLLNLALMTENKGQSGLIRAFAEAFPPPSKVELWLGGDGPIRRRLESEVLRSGLAERVRFLGRVASNQVPALLKRVDIMVVASHYETFGVVAAEALMVGVPVVATRCGGPECIVGEGDGALVPPRDSRALADAMASVVRRLAQFQRAEIAERARERFSGSAVACQLEKIYERVVAREAAA